MCINLGHHVFDFAACTSYIFLKRINREAVWSSVAETEFRSTFEAAGHNLVGSLYIMWKRWYFVLRYGVDIDRVCCFCFTFSVFFTRCTCAFVCPQKMISFFCLNTRHTEAWGEIQLVQYFYAEMAVILIPLLRNAESN